MSLEKQIQSWVSLDNRLRELNEEVRELRTRRSETCSEIMTIVKERNLDNAVINISDGKLRFVETRQLPSLTFKYVEQCLKKCLSDSPDKVKEIMEVLKTNREAKLLPEIKRSYIEE